MNFHTALSNGSHKLMHECLPKQLFLSEKKTFGKLFVFISMLTPHQSSRNSFGRNHKAPGSRVKHRTAISEVVLFLRQKRKLWWERFSFRIGVPFSPSLARNNKKIPSPSEPTAVSRLMPICGDN
jgi:hypothetical protein